MSYIIVDLEWNQAMSSTSPVFNHLPIHLRGEIIEIGAVKLNSDLTPGEEFRCYVNPVWFKKMHYKVKALTGIDSNVLSHALSFPKALKKFLSWCGPDCTFMTWGFDDSGIMEQNCIIHDLDIDWMGKWINLQVIYNILTEDEDHNQKSLETAMEHFGIEQTRSAHDALGDAYNTALVCSRLDLTRGLALYQNHQSDLSRKICYRGQAPISHTVSSGYPSRESLWKAVSHSRAVCPVCSADLGRARWINQGNHRYMAMASCPQHGSYLCRIRIHQDEDGLWRSNRMLYTADEEIKKKYQAKASPARRSRSGRKKKVKRIEEPDSHAT